MKRNKKNARNKAGKENIRSRRNYTSVVEHKQHLIDKLPILRLYAPLYPADTPEGGRND